MLTLECSGFWLKKEDRVGLPWKRPTTHRENYRAALRLAISYVRISCSKSNLAVTLVYLKAEKMVTNYGVFQLKKTC